MLLALKSGRVNKVKSRFLVNMSFEICTPLNGGAGLLRRMGSFPCRRRKAVAHGGAVVAESERSLTQAVGQPESRGGESGDMPLLPLLHEMLINESYILQYKKSGATMLKYLRDGILGQLQCLDQTVQAEAWGEYALVAHKMVGSCILIEGDELPNLLRSMQACGAAGRSEACRERLEILRPYIYKISEEAGNHLKRIE